MFVYSILLEGFKMFFLRIDYLPSTGGVHRVRGLYETFEQCLKVLKEFDSSNVLLARCELCS